MRTTKEIKLLELECTGEYIFVYSDRYNIFLFFLDHEENKLYKITTDKFYDIQYIDEIYTPLNFMDYKKIKFFKPLVNNGDYIFIGIVVFEDKAYRFKIEYNNKLVYTEESRFTNNEGIIGALNCLKNIVIYNYIQKRNKLYLIGYDNEYNDYIYSVVNIEDDKLEKVYSLFSDYGDIIPASINIDVDENKVYVAGKIIYYNKENKAEKVTPYFEAFMFS